MALVHLLYASTATAALTAAERVLLVREARVFNAVHGVTGILLFSGARCFQVLEGESGVVDSLYLRIKLDPRHANVTLLTRDRIERREHEGWSMSAAYASTKQLWTAASLEASPHSESTQFSPTDAQRMLTVLRTETRWRVPGPDLRSI